MAVGFDAATSCGRPSPAGLAPVDAESRVFGQLFLRSFTFSTKLQASVYLS